MRISLLSAILVLCRLSVYALPASLTSPALPKTTLEFALTSHTTEGRMRELTPSPQAVVGAKLRMTKILRHILAPLYPHATLVFNLNLPGDFTLLQVPRVSRESIFFTIEGVDYPAGSMGWLKLGPAGTYSQAQYGAILRASQDPNQAFTLLGAHSPQGKFQLWADMMLEYMREYRPAAEIIEAFNHRGMEAGLPPSDAEIAERIQAVFGPLPEWFFKDGQFTH